jgi:hypothetical protein
MESDSEDERITELKEKKQLIDEEWKLVAGCDQTVEVLIIN